MKVQNLLLFCFVILLFSCSGEEEEDTLSTVIKGEITVNPELDSTGDYSGIELISSIQTAEDKQDTLFYAVTDSSGKFNATATISNNDIYPILISRNNNTFGIVNVVLAQNDTVQLTAQLPYVNETMEIQSQENEVFSIYERVDRNFSRVARYINAGAISADSVEMEVNKWSDIYWDIYEKYTGTYGAKLAGESSVTLLSGFNDSLMVSRSRELLKTYDDLGPATRNTLVQFYAETEGLNGALAFIESLKHNTDDKNDLIELEMHRIEILYDSSQTLQATQVLDQFKETYAENEAAIQWAEDISYDIEFLAPGYPFPNLSFQLLNGDTLQTSELRGTPFLLEITRFDDPLYQEQFNRTVAIHQIYRNFGLDIITVPLATTDVTLNAFFEERRRLWKVVQPNSFDTEELIERLNLNRLPTRFLVDSDGNIIRRYIAEEYDEIVRGLQQITTQNEN